MTQTARLWWDFRTLVTRVAAAVGHAMIFWLFVELVCLIVDDTGAFSQANIVLISGLTAWLFCVPGTHRTRLWRFALAGYLAVALDVTIALGIATTVQMGRFDLTMTTTSVAAVLLWVVAPWGTLMAVASAIYGMLLRRFAASGIAQRAAP